MKVCGYYGSYIWLKTHVSMTSNTHVVPVDLDLLVVLHLDLLVVFLDLLVVLGLDLDLLVVLVLA